MIEELTVIIDQRTAMTFEEHYLLRFYANPQPVVIAHFMGASFHVWVNTTGYV